MDENVKCKMERCGFTLFYFISFFLDSSDFLIPNFNLLQICPSHPLRDIKGYIKLGKNMKNIIYHQNADIAG